MIKYQIMKNSKTQKTTDKFGVRGSIIFYINSII